MPMKTVLSELVQPVIAGKVDMAMVEYSDKVCVCVCAHPMVCVACVLMGHSRRRNNRVRVGSKQVLLYSSYCMSLCIHKHS